MQEFKEILRDINKSIKSVFPFYSGAYFFGSRTNGTYTEDSDYDVVFAFAGDVNNTIKKEVVEIVYNYELQNDIIIDAMVFSMEDIINPKTPFRNNVKEEGQFFNA